MDDNTVNRGLDNRAKDDELRPLDLVAILWKKRVFIMIVVAVFIVGSVIYSFSIVPTFESRTTLMPISSDGGSTLSQYAGLAQIAGISLPTGGGAATPSQKIVAILKSRSLCERIVRDLNLVPKIIEKPENFKNRDPFKLAVASMQKQILSIANDDKSGIITITVEFTDPEYAQKIASDAVTILEQTLNEKSFTVTSKTSQLLEEQIAEQGKKVADLQTRMAKFQSNTKIIDPQGQVTSAMTLYGSLLQQKIALLVELSRYENSLSADNPKILTLRSQLDEIDKQIKNIQSKTGIGSFSIENAPEQIAEYQSISTDLEVSTRIYASLLATYENQKLSEAQDQLFVEVVDPPIVPEQKSKPQRSKIVFVGTIAGIFFSFLGAFAINAWHSTIDKIKGKLA